jgi:radical SAM superfamily enzyme YgiQ (UPF0313 family)
MIVLINPNLVAQKDDLFTTGIVYMPIGLAYLAATLKKNGHQFKVIDAFGEKPSQVHCSGDFLIQGLSEKEVVKSIPQDTKIIFIYAINVASHIVLISMAQAIKKEFLKIPIVAVENTQAVTAYSLREVQQDLYENGVDYILTGEPEKRGIRLVEAILSGKEDFKAIDGLGYKINGKAQYCPPLQDRSNLDELPFPAWENFPLANYWGLKYGHGPLETGKYLPLLTSRGCPYGCRFCSMPSLNNQKWRGRTAKNIADEMEYFQKRFGINEFHIEDVNPTVSDIRTQEFCREILERKLKVIWKLASGTKVETLKNEKTIELMAKTGCNYISISPETGSPKVLESMNKPFDLGHAVRIVKKMRSLNIFSQACFVLGFPGETKEDIKLTGQLIKQMTRAGIDEVAVFIITPVPGSQLFSELQGYYNFSQLTFSPAWRKDYKALNLQRLKFYAIFFINKALFHFPKIAVQPFRFLKVSFKTKMEMVPYRVLKIKLALWRRKKNEL